MVGKVANIRKTKVIATLGPACDPPGVMRDMIAAGMDVARLNLSHGDAEEHRDRLRRVREASREAGREIATMVDTKGLEIRVGEMEDGEVLLEAGQPFTLSTGARVGNMDGAAVNYPDFPGVVKSGMRILLDDGAMELEVKSVAGSTVETRVLRGGRLRSAKGLNLPGVDLGCSGVDEATRGDVVFAAENDVDYLAASFICNAQTVAEIRKILADHGAEIPIIAKIENRAGVEHLDDIVAEADGTMVARGDLGVELSVVEVPSIQKKIIRTTVTSGKPVVTATQMLDSMERNPRPTRAEASDVVNAILDGTSAVMLSGETAVGKYPVEAVQTIAALAMQAEYSLEEYGYLQNILPHLSNIVTEAVSQAAITMANHLGAAAIFTLTETGFTSRLISKYRPSCPILAITSSRRVVHKLCMNWGVIPILYEGAHSDDARVAFAIREAKERGYVRTGDLVVATAGRSQRSGGTDMISVMTLD